MPMQKDCDRCGKEVERFKYLKKVNGERICKVCYKENRDIKRKNMIENSESLKNDLRELRNLEQRNYLRKKRGCEVKRGRPRSIEPPIPRGSTSGKTIQKNKSNSYITFQERQILLKTLVQRGISFEDAKDRISEVTKEQERIRREMKQQNKSEEEISTKQKQMIEELWRT